MSGNGQKPPGASAPGGPPSLSREEQQFLQAMGQGIFQSLAGTYPEVVKVRPTFVQECAAATIQDVVTWGPVAQLLMTPKASEHAVILTIVKPAVLVGSEEQVIAEIAGRLDTTQCDTADEILQSMTVVGFLTSPDMRSRLYMKGYRIRGKLLKLQALVDPPAKS